MEAPSTSYFVANFLAVVSIYFDDFATIYFVDRPLVVLLVLSRILGVMRRILITLVVPLIIVRT